MKIMDDFCTKWKPSRAYYKMTLFVVNKDKWDTVVVSLWRMHCMYSSMAKGTSWAESMSNSKKVKHIALAIVELREPEGMRQAGS